MQMDKKQDFPRGTPGKRLYAIGDVHGRYDLLMKLLEKIERHNSGAARKDTSIVLLGDLIDRGPQSANVLDFLRVAQPEKFRFYALMGNHEELMLRALRGDALALDKWLRNGGSATLKSYGVDVSEVFSRDLPEVQRQLNAAIDPRHVSIIRSFLDSIRFGDFLLVHAGVRPGVDIERQTPHDLRWIREPFLSSQTDHGLVIVHGHCALPGIVERPNRIGIDTGAWRTGVLTAIWIEDDRRGFLQVIDIE